ncbi:MAG TPA: ethanolamine ammonia-lyase subunit EutC [Tepidisphaeraceae bacterium]|jgi:ethanolamine ammonia-lyase small subunit|nr:ethanolamine ammonia-lyase subunit EutC [Tepidisphaeraceae bacterium]
MSNFSPNLPDPWSGLRRHTPARIALGRAGGSLPTKAVLEFAVAHAAARDAVHAALDIDALAESLRELGLGAIQLSSRALDRATYLHRPDLGRRLDAPSLSQLRQLPPGEIDIVIIIGDGLSAPAPQQQALPLLRELIPLLQADGLRIGPICIVREARVAIEDEIGAELRARAAVILVGERPGLGSADSLGAYLVFDPKIGRTDAERNCVSNIRPGGLGVKAAAATLHYLIAESLRRRISGVALKDERVLPSEYLADCRKEASAP